MTDLFVAQRGRGLVQNEQFRRFQKCRRNSYLLSLAKTELFYQYIRAEVRVQQFKLFRYCFSHPAKIQQSKLPYELATKESVPGHVETRHKRRVLMYNGNTLFLRITRAAEIHLFPIENDLSAIMTVNARDDFHQSGFTGPVSSKQGMDLPGFTDRFTFLSTWFFPKLLVIPLHSKIYWQLFPIVHHQRHVHRLFMPLFLPIRDRIDGPQTVSNAGIRINIARMRMPVKNQGSRKRGPYCQNAVVLGEHRLDLRLVQPRIFPETLAIAHLSGFDTVVSGGDPAGCVGSGSKIFLAVVCALMA